MFYNNVRVIGIYMTIFGGHNVIPNDPINSMSPMLLRDLIDAMDMVVTLCNPTVEYHYTVKTGDGNMVKVEDYNLFTD